MKPLERVTRILLVRTDRLGETVLNLPVAAALKAAWPDGSLTWLAHPLMQPLLEPLPDVEEVWVEESAAHEPWWRQALRLAHRWRRGAFDVVVISNPTKAYHVAAWLAGIPRRVGYDHKWAWALTHRVPDRKSAGDRHEVVCHLDLVKALGVSVADIPPLRLPVPPEEQRWASEQLNDRSGAPRCWVAVHPWTSNPAKQWPLERFREVILRVRQQWGAGVVVVGEKPLGAPLAAVAPTDEAGVLDLTGQTSLRQLAALLAQAEVLISNDSGPVHLAAAVGTPVIALFGTAAPATGPARWGPWGLRHTVIHRHTLAAIRVEDVLAALPRYLEPARASSGNPEHAASSA